MSFFAACTTFSIICLSGACIINSFRMGKLSDRVNYLELNSMSSRMLIESLYETLNSMQNKMNIKESHRKP